MTTQTTLLVKKINEIKSDWDEQSYIDEALDALIEIHGSYNLQDQRLVKQMATFARSFEMADSQLISSMSHLQQTGSNGIQPSTWFRLRESANAAILKIRKDLGLDLASRNHAVTGRQADESLFTSRLKEEKELVRR